MGHLLDVLGFSSAFRFKILKPMFINFLLATNVFDMPASMFCRYLDFFDIERATPMLTWDQGTRNLYRAMTRSFESSIHLGRGVRQIIRSGDGVVVRDDRGSEERFDDVVLACHANQALMMLEEPTLLERWLLSSVRYESELHNHAIVHSDESVLPKNATRPLETRSNFIVHYGSRPDNYEITYIMHNQQPWAGRSDRPCLVTYNPVQPIDPGKIIARHWFQHVVHDVFHVSVLMGLFPLIQGRGGVWYCGAHTLINSQEHCFVSGLTVARRLGADYPFDDGEARGWFNFYGRLMHGIRFPAA
jgi:predicted NAD/FAD-binding protein